MQARAAQYLNEIVSLTMMALLVVALAAGQRAATGEAAAIDTPVLVAGEDFGFRHEGE